MSSIQYRFLVGFGVPILLSVAGILGKKLTRGRSKPSWKRTDFYLGVELTLAGVSAGIVNMFDLLMKPGRVFQPSDGRLVLLNFVVSFLGIFLFMYVITLHQDYENEANTAEERKKELHMLAGLANVLGGMVLLAGVSFMSI